MVQTSIYGKPALAYPRPSYFDPLTNAFPDAADPNLVIPMILTSYSPPKRTPKVNTVTSLPIVDISTGTTWGGSAISFSSQELPKATMDGTIDTPTINWNGWRLAALHETADVGQRFTFGEFIQACTEGRIAYTTDTWQVQNPTWFRDPYGRRYDNIRVFDFTASFVESVPGRTTFNMTLVVS